MIPWWLALVPLVPVLLLGVALGLFIGWPEIPEAIEDPDYVRFDWSSHRADGLGQ